MFGNSGEKEKDNSAQSNVWQQVLKESSSRTHLLEEKSIIVLGNRSSGKSSLVARLQNAEPAPEGASNSDGVALDYAYLDIYPTTHSDELLGRANVWSLEGDLGHAPLLDFGLNEGTLHKSIAVCVLDLSVPWKLEESLEKWLKVLSDHILVLKSKLGKGVFEGLQRKNILAFQQYRDPSTTKASADPTSHALVSSLSSSSVSVDLETEELPTLGDGILTHNLGVPIVVVCSKTDAIAMLEKEYSYKDDTFVYIQQYLRRVCLKYGAALLYASAKRNSNCDILKSYLLHQLYGFEFSASAQLVDKDTIFVPSGWDSLPKIEIEFSNQKVCSDADLPFSEVIKRPAILQQHKSIYEAEVVAEDDQDFLSNKLKLIEKAEQQQTPASSILTNSPLTTHAGSSPSEPTTPYTAVDKTPVRRPPVGLQTPKDAKTFPGGASSAALGGSTPGFSPLILPEGPGARGTGPSPRSVSAKTNEHKVLSDFFSGLLSKDVRKGSAGGTPVGTGTRPPPARTASSANTTPTATTNNNTTTAATPPTTNSEGN
eukprot:TRINITY_DN1510_c2_g1_i1.p1 TRINITY_DN1510_c2_g1~~TRINITY_DN1510_c2_g1_i1.p1  ORF type:complete len:542 (+),score=137.95 TRINITY_DN1510_c2_g1_i1:182-1807(+)